MNWGIRCLHQSSDIHLIPVGTPLVQNPYGLAVQFPAHGNFMAYLREGDLIVQRPDSLSGLIDSHQAPVAHHNKSTSDYLFEDWIAPTSAGTNLWSFNSTAW